MRPVALTMGDAAGIGPEVIVKTFVDDEFIARHPAFVLGDPACLRAAAARHTPRLRVQAIASPEALDAHPGVLPVLAACEVPPDLPPGRVDARAGRAAFEAIRAAIELGRAGRVEAICTAPIHKEALARAGVPYPGHTEMLADLTATGDYAMMLENERLRVVLVTVHCALAEAIARIETALELRILRLTARSLRAFGIARPRIAVAALNPHAGEGGLFGREEIEIIAPAVAQARAEGIEASGPHAPDTVFMQARAGRFDAVIAQYHDQGLIPIKLLGLAEGVNITLGLPFVRTSPDHGTAFDIAGQGRADPASLRAALATAHRLAAARRAPTGADPRD